MNPWYLTTQKSFFFSLSAVPDGIVKNVFFKIIVISIRYLVGGEYFSPLFYFMNYFIDPHH